MDLPANIVTCTHNELRALSRPPCGGRRNSTRGRGGAGRISCGDSDSHCTVALNPPSFAPGSGERAAAHP